MNYYDTFIYSYVSPSKKWRDGLQYFVDKEFDNASTYYEDVEEEIDFGSLVFKPIRVRVTTIVDAKTGQRVNDDYKKLIFPDLSYNPTLGTRYRFENNIWITFSTDNIKTDTSSVYIRRCNNVMKIQDRYGNIHVEPIYIDYKVTENQIFKNYTMDVPSGRIWFQCQKNKYTKDININDRFMFGNDVYKVRERSRFDRRFTFDENSSYTISYYADYDNKSDADNEVIGIANYKVYNYHIEAIESISNIVGYEDKLNVSVYLDDNLIEEDLVFQSTDESIATIDEDGNYKFLNEGKCQFICQMKNKIDVSHIINISVEKEIIKEYNDVLLPEIDTIKLNETVEYTIYEYLNGKETDTGFTITAKGLTKKNYIIEFVNENTFRITNLKPSQQNLEISCVNKRNDNITKAIIRLGGMI